MSTSRDRELRSDVQEIQDLLNALQQGTLQELLEVPASFLEADEARLLQLVLLQRTINEVNALRGAVGGLREVGDTRAVGDRSLADADPVAALLSGDLRRFGINKTLQGNEDIFEEDIELEGDTAVLRVTLALDTSTTVSAVVRQGGENSGANSFNEGNALGIGQIFAFDLPGIPGDAVVNYQVGAAANANLIAVTELNAQAP